MESNDYELVQSEPKLSSVTNKTENHNCSAASEQSVINYWGLKLLKRNDCIVKDAETASGEFSGTSFESNHHFMGDFTMN